MRIKTAIPVARTLAVWLGTAGCMALAFPTALCAAPPDSFSAPEATQLLREISAGLVSHNPKRMLAAFDLARMTNGAVFEQNTLSFFSQTGIIRVHFNGLRTSMDGAKGLADVAFEMEANMADDRLPVLRKQEELHLVCEKSSAGWRITGLEPRDFFTTQQ